jgi:hypothetical protein
MQYSLLIYQTAAQFAGRTDPVRRDAIAGAFMGYVRALQEAGVLVTTLAWAGRAPFEHCGPVEVRPTRVVPAA